MSDSSAETLSSEGHPDGDGTGTRRRRSALGMSTVGSRATALTAALSLVLVGGVATAAYRAFQSSTAPDTLVPANAFAFGSVDLSLPGGQDSALRTFLDHFSGSPTKTGDGSTIDRLLRAAFKDSSDPHVDYDKDIKPWLGDHIAAAGWLDSSEQPQYEVLVQSTDTDQAIKSINRLNAADSATDNAAMIASDGYVVVAQTTALAHEAVNDAKQHSLAGTSLFRSDINALPGDDPAVGWLDGSGLSNVIKTGVDQGGTGIDPFTTLGGIGKLANVHLAVGMHAADNYIELDSVTHGGGQTANSSSSDLMTHLPNRTVAALELGDPGHLVDGIGKVLSLATGFLTPATESFSSGDCASAPLPEKLQQKLIRASTLPPAQRERLLRQVMKQMPARTPSGAAITSTCTESTFGSSGADSDPLQAFSQFTGLTFPDDVKTLLGDRAVITYGGLGGGYPSIGLRSHPSDLPAAHDKALALQHNFELHTGIGIDVENAGGDLVIASTPTYGGQLAATGGLGDQPGFRTAMGDLPGTVDAAVYVDLGNILTTATLFGGGVPANVRHIKGIGAWSSHDGDTQRGQFRFVVG